MSGVHPNFDPANLYFVTTTAVQHAHLFRRDVVKRIIVDSLDYMRVQRWIKLHAFVVMPNHIHFIARFLEGHILSDVMREFKKHTSKQIVRQYQVEANRRVLAFLERAACDIPDQRYKVWDDGYDARDVFSPDFLRQKVEYIHNNPCQPQWNLAARPEDYPWSSARYYVLGEPAIIAVDHVGELMV